MDIPYADSFTCEEKWEISAPEGNNQKCFLKISFWVNFTKSTILKNKISSKSMSGAKEEFESWFAVVTKMVSKKIDDN